MSGDRCPDGWCGPWRETRLAGRSVLVCVDCGNPRDHRPTAHPGTGSIEELAKVLAQHAGCVANDSRSTGWADGSGVTGVDVWSCGIRVPFVEDLEVMERLHLAHALEAHVDGVRPDALGRIDERIERLEEVAYRWDVPGGSRRLAQRARDKVAGLELARRLVARESR